MYRASPMQSLSLSARAGRRDRDRSDGQSELNRCESDTAGRRSNQDVLARLKRSHLEKSTIGREILHPNRGKRHAANVGRAGHYGVRRNKDFFAVGSVVGLRKGG